MTVAAVSRCIGVLECLAGAVGGLELGDIAARLDMPKSAVHRVLSTLVQHGWVVQEPETQNYALSLRFSTLAFHDLDVRIVTDVVQQVLDRLAAETREYCRLAVVQGETLAWVARAQGATAGLRYDADMGQEVALHATATGKAWLSTLPESEALRIVCARNFHPHLSLGPRAVSGVEALKRHLAETRARGYASAIEEAEPGIVALAAPFRADARPDAQVAGTVSVAGPMSRITPDRFDQLGAQLQAAAEELRGIWRLRARQRIQASSYGVRIKASKPDRPAIAG